ncbi:hypothetical protein YC2023_078820 [Brassica napus]
MLFLTLSHNKLSGEVFPESVKFTPLKELSMDNNRFTGKIGEGLRNLEILDLLDISYNNLTGVIPRWISGLELTSLLISNNMLEGEIPISIFSMSSLQLLDLSTNMLEGGIPSHRSPKDFGVKQMYGIYFKSLIVLSPFILISEPTILIKIQFATKHRYDSYMGGNLQLLFGMDLAENELSGEIPVELVGLLEIQGLNLSHNNLTGMIPESFSVTMFLWLNTVLSVAVSHSLLSLVVLSDDFINGFVEASTDASFSTRILLTHMRSAASLCLVKNKEQL